MQNLILFFDVKSCHEARRNINWYFLEVLQRENKVKWEKPFGSKYFLAYCFIKLLVNYLLPHGTLCHLSMTQRSWENLDHIKFKVTIHCDYWGKKIQWGKKSFRDMLYCCWWPQSESSTLQWLFFAHSGTPISEVCLEPLWPSCGHGVKSTFLLGRPNG